MPDRVKVLGRITSGTNKVLLADAPYTTTDPKEWILMPPDLDPDTDLMHAVEWSQHLIYFPTFIPGVVFRDGDNSDPGVSEWVSDSDITIVKTSNQRYNESTYRALQMTFVATTSRSQIEPYYCDAGDQLALYASLTLVSGGPVSWEIINHTTGALIGERITVSTRAPQTIGGGFTVPAGCDAINQKITAPAGTVVVFDEFPGANLGDVRMPAPECLDAPHKLIGFGPASYGRTIAPRAYASRSRQLQTWMRSVDFGDPEGLAGEGVLPKLPVYRKSLPENPYWFYCYRPWSDRYPLDGEQKFTNAPEHLAKAAAVYVMGMRLRTKRQTGAYDALIKYSGEILDGQYTASMPDPAPDETQVTVIGGRGGDSGSFLSW